MTDYAVVTSTDRAELEPGAARTSTFSPERAGPVTIVSLSPGARSRRGVAGEPAVGQARSRSVELIRPDGTVAAHTAGDRPALILTTTASPAEAGKAWSFRVTNCDDQASHFTTELSMVSSTPLAWASLDTGLLDSLLPAMAQVAGLVVSLRSDPDRAASEVRWSEAVAGAVGTRSVHFTLPDIEAIGFRWQVRRLRSAPGGLTLAIGAGPDGEVVLSAVLRFDAEGARIAGLDAPDIDLGRLALSATVRFDGALDIGCDLRITRPHLPAHDELSDHVRQLLLDRAREELAAHDVTPGAVKGVFEALLKNLMRLDPSAQVQRHRIEGRRLLVGYHLPVAQGVRAMKSATT